MILPDRFQALVCFCAALAVGLIFPGAVSLAGTVTVMSDPVDAGLVNSIKIKADNLISRMRTEFGFPEPGPVTIVLASTEAAYLRAQPPGIPAPDWSAGVAYPELGLIVLKTGKALPGVDLDVVLAHELYHILFSRMFKGGKAPKWLEEGLAMHISGELGFSRRTAIVRAMISGRLIPLSSLMDSFPDDILGAETAYAESYYFVAFIREEYGPGALATMLRALGMGASPEVALFHAVHRPYRLLEKDFSVWLSQRFSLLLLLTRPEAMWALAALLLAGAMVWKRRSMKKKLAEWEAEEDGAEEDIDGSGGVVGSPGGEDPL